MIRTNHQLDAKGLACPMPIVKTKKAITDLEEGQVLEVQATDKGSKADLAAWAKSVGHQYLGTVEEGDVLYHYIRKGSNEPEVEKTFEHTVSLDELGSRDGLILDVREAAEYAFGHLEGAISIPMGELESRLTELNKDQELYVVCRTGKRSDLVAQLLTSKGFNKVYNVLPGMTEWNGKIKKDIYAELIKPNKEAIIAANGGMFDAYKVFNIATAAAASDKEVQIFFTFEGLNLIHKQAMHGLEMPAGKEHFAEGFEKANVPTIPQLVEMAQDLGVKFI